MISQNIGDTIKSEYKIKTGAVLLENNLTLNQGLDGVGGCTWLFEVSNNNLIILTFAWPVLPDAKPRLEYSYALSNTDLSYVIQSIDIEYSYCQEEDTDHQKIWMNYLTGQINQSIQIDIKVAQSFYTDVKDVEFLKLMDKYALKIKNEQY